MSNNEDEPKQDAEPQSNRTEVVESKPKRKPKTPKNKKTSKN